jgi:hypothetical protein
LRNSWGSDDGTISKIVVGAGVGVHFAPAAELAADAMGASIT